LDMARTAALRDPFTVLPLRRLARRCRVLHVHSSKAAALGRVAAATLPRRARPAVVMTPHYWSWLVGGRLEGLYRWIERLLARRCDVIVAVSEREEAEGRSVLGPDARLLLIPNGVDRAHFSPEGPSAGRDVDHALIVPREDPGALAGAIDVLLRDPGKRKALGLAARAQSRPYDVSVTMRRNLDLWADLVHGGAWKEGPHDGSGAIGSTAPATPSA